MRGNEPRQRRDDARNRYVLIIRGLRIRTASNGLRLDRRLELADGTSGVTHSLSLCLARAHARVRTFLLLQRRVFSGAGVRRNRQLKITKHLCEKCNAYNV